MEINDLKEYILKTDLDKDWNVLNDKIHLHWSNWDLSYRLVKKLFNDNIHPNLINFNLKTKELLATKYINRTLLDLYEELFTKKDKSSFFINQNEYSDLKWFNRETNQKFIYYKILNNNDVRPRNFRYKTNINVLVQSSINSDPISTIHINQISNDGLLLKIDKQTYEQIKDNDLIYLKLPKINTDYITNNVNKTLSLLKTDDIVSSKSFLKTVDLKDVITKYNNNSIENQYSDDKYIFILFKDIHDSKNEVKSNYDVLTNFIHYFLLYKIDSIVE